MRLTAFHNCCGAAILHDLPVRLPGITNEIYAKAFTDQVKAHVAKYGVTLTIVDPMYQQEEKDLLEKIGFKVVSNFFRSEANPIFKYSVVKPDDKHSCAWENVLMMYEGFPVEKVREQKAANSKKDGYNLF